MFRFRRLVAVLSRLDAFALAVSRWIDELLTWEEIVYAKEIAREDRNHNPWAFDFSDTNANAFAGGTGDE